MTKKRNGKDWEENYAYGRYAEIEIAKFFQERGWRVSFAEDYGFFLEDKERGGPRISYPPTYQSYSCSDEVETSFITIVAPDLHITKQNTGEKRFVEVKRREKFSKFNSDEVIYLDANLFYDYCELNYSFGNVYFFLYVDGSNGQEEIYTSHIGYMQQNIQYKTKDFVSFNKKIFNRIK